MVRERDLVDFFFTVETLPIIVRKFSLKNGMACLRKEKLHRRRTFHAFQAFNSN